MADSMDLLECPVCMEPIYPPIFQCPNGHLLCSVCKAKIANKCPICRQDVGDIRSLALEKMAASLKFPCRYNWAGCSRIYRYDSKKQHEQECKFRPFNCPYPYTVCTVTGDLQSMLWHFEHDHASAILQGCKIDQEFSHIHPYNGESYSFNISVYKFDGECFILHFEVFASPLDMVYMAFLTYMGEEADATNFRYSLSVKKDNRVISWTGTPRSIREGLNQIRNSHDGLVIHRSVAHLLAEINSEEELKLRVGGEIWKE